MGTHFLRKASKAVQKRCPDVSGVRQRVRQRGPSVKSGNVNVKRKTDNGKRKRKRKSVNVKEKA